MRALILTTVLACAAFAAPSAIAQHDTKNADTANKAVNKMCPIGKEPIVESAGTVEYDGHQVGLCCPGCGKQFLAWSNDRKAKFITAALKGDHGDTHKHEAEKATQDAVASGSPYPLTTCPVADSKLGSMGDPVVRNYEGREVRFCCASCISKFEGDKAGYFKKIDEQIIADQLPHYPLNTCVVTDEPLTENGQDIATNIVHDQRLVRLCCKMCIRKFKADPAPFLAKLDKAAATAQRDDYPLDTCIVAGGKLGSMGDPTEIIVAGRLFRFCCASCEPKVEADPARYIAEIDKAWQAKGNFVPAAAAGGDHGNHDHGG